MNIPSQHNNDVVANISQAIADYREGLARIHREYDAASRRPAQSAQDGQLEDANRTKRTRNWQSGFARNWQTMCAEAGRSNLELLRTQATLAELRQNHPPAATHNPVAIAFGSCKMVFEGLSCISPCAIAFPLTQAIAFQADDSEQKHLAHQLLLRLLSALPPGQLELTFIDPFHLGKSVSPFLPLLKVAQLVPQQRVLTRSDDIEAALGTLTDEVEYLIQHRFNETTATWSAHNARHADDPLPYKVVVLFDAPEQLSDRSLWFLERLCESGPRCGILPVVAMDEHRMQDRRHATLRATLAASGTHFNALLAGTHAASTELAITYQGEQWPCQEGLDGFLATLVERFAEKANFKKSLPDLWTQFTRGATTSDDFDIPIGWSTAGEPVSLVLGATISEHHALLAGKTGSGKSNLLHVLIHSLCEKYSPAEVDLYLLDYKESTEFAVYAAPPLPHARLVATESDPEYGVTVLHHLVSELEQRGRIFKKVGVSAFLDYRIASGVQLPRVLLIIDEFQVLFSGKRQLADEAERLLSQLLKQGRAFGIHILLATQTLKGIHAQSISSIVTQLGCRMALACGPEDSAMILGGNNWAAAELRSPPEAIINNANGAKSGNVKFRIPLADNALCRKHIATLAGRATRAGTPAKTRVFSGADLPALPLPGTNRAGGGQHAILLGEQLTFDACPLAVPLTRRSAFNVLFSGYDDQIHDGLLASLLSGLACVGFDDIVYYNGRGVAPGGGFPAAAQALGAQLTTFDDLAALPLQAILDDIGTRSIALIVDGFDAEKALHPAPSFRVPKPGESASPADLLKRIAEEGPRKGVFVFAFVDRWQRCASSCKELFAFFELRVAYCMNEDDAGSLVSGGIGKFKGIEKPNRAVLVNRMTNDMTWFRPFVHKSPQ